MSTDAMIVNIFGGPGAGKSTLAAVVFAGLKEQQCNCELVTEFAKDLVWSEQKLDDQIYIFGEQYHRLHVLRDKVDVIVTDSPLLLSSVYGKQVLSSRLYPAFDLLVYQTFLDMDNFNVYLHRNNPYHTVGRTQTLDEAEKIDDRVMAYLLKHDINVDVYHEDCSDACTVVHGVLAT